MNKEEILKASRKENKNKDLAEIEVMYQAGSHASRVGALACCLVSLLSSMLGTYYALQSVDHILQYDCNTMASSIY